MRPLCASGTCKITTSSTQCGADLQSPPHTPHHSSHPPLACPEPHKHVTHQAHSTLHVCCARVDATGGYSADYGDEGGYDEDDTATQV
jgi:hypothetical protein